MILQNTKRRQFRRTPIWRSIAGAALVCLAAVSCSTAETAPGTDSAQVSAPATSTEATLVEAQEFALDVAQTSTGDPQSVTGTFTIDNTTANGAAVLVETIRVLVELQASETDEWPPFPADCTTEPPAPVEVSEQLVVTYECELRDGIPNGEHIRVIAEVTIFGNDEVFRLVATTEG